MSTPNPFANGSAGSLTQVANAIQAQSLQNQFTQVVFNGWLAGIDSLKQTAAEIAAGVTPVNYAYAPLDCRRYGAATSDAVGNTNLAAINAALSVANNIAGGGIATLPGGNFNINGAIVGYTNTYLAGQGMGMGQPTNPDFTNGGTSITQLNGSADVIDFVNASSCGCRDISLIVGAGGNGVMWQSNGSNQNSYFQLTNVSVNLGANSAGIGIWLNPSSAGADQYFPRLTNVTVTGQSESAYGTKIGIRIGNAAGTFPVVYGTFDNVLINGCQTLLDLQRASNNKFSGLTLYNAGTGTGRGINGVIAGNNVFYGLLVETGTITQYVISWSNTSNDNHIFMMDISLASASVNDLGVNNQYFGDDGGGGFVNQFGSALNLYDVRKITIGRTQTPVGTTQSLYYATTATVNPGLIAANTTAEITVSISGMLSTDQVIATPQAGLEAGLVGMGYPVSGGYRVRLANVTVGGITPASRNWTITVLR